MKISLIGPELCPPWTEGRKNLVRDLARYYAETGHDVIVGSPTLGMSSTTARSPWAWMSRSISHLTFLLQAQRSIRSHAAGSYVFHFPFGTFRGVKGWVNRAGIRWLDAVMHRSGVRGATVLYSVEGELSLTMSDLHLPLVSGTVPGTSQVPFGIEHEHWPDRPQPLGRRRLLFLAGATAADDRTFDHILNVRGLKVVLAAGKSLAPLGYSLTIGCPALVGAAQQRRVRLDRNNTWPASHLEVRGEVDVPEIYFEHDIYLFTYSRDIASFRPTSVLESVAAGTPVVMSDVPFLSQFRDVGGVVHFQSDDPDSLADTVVSLSDTARAPVEPPEDFSVRYTAERLLEVAEL